VAWGILVGVKERLTGAIILVALIVLLVPELLTGPTAGVTARRASGSGHSPVRTYTLPLAGRGPSAPWGVQTGVFPRQADALRMQQQLRIWRLASRINRISIDGRPQWRVVAGPVNSRAAAEVLERQLRAHGMRGAVRQM